MARRLYLFSGCNLIEEPAKTIRADGTPKYSNRRSDDCTFFSGHNLIDEGRNPPKNIAHNFHFSKYDIYGDTQEHWIVLEAAQNTNTTHIDTTTNKMSRATLPSSSFAPSLSMGRAVAPLNHGAAAPQRHAQAASCQGYARCHWFACLRRQNKRHQIIERVGVPWP